MLFQYPPWFGPRRDNRRELEALPRYLYSTEELQELVPPVAESVSQAAESHLLMSNCYRDYSVRNAAELRDLLVRYTGS